MDRFEKQGISVRVARWIAKGHCSGSAVVSPIPVHLSSGNRNCDKILGLLGPETRHQHKQIHDLLQRSSRNEEENDESDSEEEIPSTASRRPSPLFRLRNDGEQSNRASPQPIHRLPRPISRVSRAVSPSIQVPLPMNFPPSASAAVGPTPCSSHLPPRLPTDFEFPCVPKSPSFFSGFVSPHSPFQSPFGSSYQSPFLSPRHPFSHQVSPVHSPPPLIIREKLGSGSCGTVYKAEDRRTGQRVAVKMLHDDDSISPQEIAVLSRLNNRHIVKYLGTVTLPESRNCIVLELMSCSLASLLRNGSGLDERSIRSYTRQILYGLHYLHSKQIVHRDIKCGNILLDAANWRAKLSDFGVSKKIDLSMAKSFKGTLFYMAPEVLFSSSQGEYGLPADIWSLGCTVIEMATAKPPWTGFPMVEIIKEGGCPPIPRNLSREATDFIRSCLRRNPKDRLTAFQLLRHPFLASPKP